MHVCRHVCMYVSICSKVRGRCGQKALELQRGDARTLALQGFSAVPPKVVKGLVPDRERLPSDWVDTACMAVRAGKAVQVRKAESDSTKKGNQILWLTADLEAALAKR